MFGNHYLRPPPLELKGNNKNACYPHILLDNILVMAEENNIQENSDSESEGSEDSPRRPAISLAIPKNFQHIDGSEVAKIVKEKDSNWVLIDVRDVDFDGGRILF